MAVTLAEAELDVGQAHPACRGCGAPLQRTFLDLGPMPLANAYLHSPDDPDPHYPLHARVCGTCLLVQADPVVAPTSLFSEYAFFSSYSAPWVEHCREYVRKVTERFKPRNVIEVASNDGCLLAEFDGFNVLGIDPAANVAKVACDNGIPTVTAFFTADLAVGIEPADLVIANNVLGHVPDLHDFVDGLRLVLAPGGVLTIEVPWLLNLIREQQFDTIYHEHFNYFSLYALRSLLAQHGLRVFDIDRLAIHGGSLRFYICHDDGPYLERWAVKQVRDAEFDAGLHHPNSEAYTEFASQVAGTVRELADFLHTESAAGQMIVGAGAPAKGNTLLNAVGATRDEVRFVTDVSPHKQGMFLPGSHIPVLAPEALTEYRPDYVLVLAWNWADAIMDSLSFVKDWGAKFVIPVPDVRIV